MKNNFLRRLFYRRKIKIKAIIYTSNTGSIAHYAKLLAEKVNLPVYNIK